MGKGSAPKPPNYGPLADALTKTAEEASKAAQDQLALQKEQFAYFKDQGVKSADLTDQIVSKYLEQTDFSFANAQKDRARYEQTFQPVEDKYVADSMVRGSEADQTAARGRAVADVGMQFDAARDANLRELEGYGINPAATRFQALDLGTRIEEAKAKAAASNVAALRERDSGDAMRLNAVNIGKGYPGQVVASTGAGTQVGNSAVGNQNSTVGTMGATQGTAPQYGSLGASYYNTASSGYGGAAGVLDTGYQNKMTAYNSTTGIGDILGLAAGIGAKAYFAAEGGAIPDGATPGGRVPMGASPTGGAVEDDVDAKLTAGEFVIPKDVVMWEGEKSLQKLIQKAREAKAGPENAKPEVKQGVTGPALFQSRPGALPVG